MMMTSFKRAARGLLLAAVSLSLPAATLAQTYSTTHHYRHYRHYRTCGAEKRAHGNNGTAVGAVTGGVLGAALGGGRAGNVLLGAGAGAVAGHAIGRSSTHC
jgi:outer membrane lipoprotein SlyB